MKFYYVTGNAAIAQWAPFLLVITPLPLRNPIKINKLARAVVQKGYSVVFGRSSHNCCYGANGL
jgi:hypothetical protein